MTDREKYGAQCTTTEIKISRNSDIDGKRKNGPQWTGTEMKIPRNRNIDRISKHVPERTAKSHQRYSGKVRRSRNRSSLFWKNTPPAQRHSRICPCPQSEND